MNIFIVTYCPYYAEYSDQISIVKAFTTEAKAKQYITEESERELKAYGVTGDFDIEELELLTDF